MTLRQTLLATLTAAVIAAPVTAQAGEDEEVFALGALAGAVAVTVIGGVVAAANANRTTTVQPLAYSGPVRVDAHTAYCVNRYRSYDVATDTFQPNHGPRRACVSPYRN